MFARAMTTAFDGSFPYEDDPVAGAATELDLDAAHLRACVAAPETAAAVKAQAEEGWLLGLRVTPGLLVNGERHTGEISVRALSAAIDASLAACDR